MIDKYQKSFLEANMAFLISEKKHYENQIYILSDRLKDKAWYPDHDYLKYEVGTAKNKLNYTKYNIKLLQDKISEIDKYNIVKYEPEQLKM